ncbi:MAG: hypothetical protein KTR24_12365 [Saprospiraceae bacterium]|nr:hypothetical protein [Saprospiraceae bacterium]
MNTIQKLCATILLLGLFWMTSNAQVQEGHLKMEITDVQVEKEEMQQMTQMMQGSTQDIYFTQEKQKVVIGMMSGMLSIQVYQDFGEDSFETYMDMMGNKIKTVMNADELKEQNKQAAELMGDAQVVYDKSDKKNIIGYDCHKATMKFEANGSAMELVLYVTDEIKVPQAYIQNLSHVQLDGTPMEMTIDVGGLMKMTYTAKELTKAIPDNFFVKPAGDYKTMTMEELQKMGLGGGFGF